MDNTVHPNLPNACTQFIHTNNKYLAVKNNIFVGKERQLCHEFLFCAQIEVLQGHSTRVKWTSTCVASVKSKLFSCLKKREGRAAVEALLSVFTCKYLSKVQQFVYSRQNNQSYAISTRIN